MRPSPRVDEKRRVGKYQIGEEIGRGAAGTVYQALNLESGDFVAVKEVMITNMLEQEFRTVYREIGLLKKLKHANIVEYVDTIKTADKLHIILEYCENGSLRHVLKRFGTLSESLVALYVAQVLEGLVYLHSQGVLHRDIKAANILTTKEGMVKLADFGVATEVRRGSQDMGNGEVVGTPFWMAPEVIEMSPATEACDIWSVGATVIELLTRKPPYYDLAPMAALFRIVQDDHPPLPEGISDSLHDFLMQTFNKEPLLRPRADAMLQHPWIVKAKARAALAKRVHQVKRTLSAAVPSVAGADVGAGGPGGDGRAGETSVVASGADVGAGAGAGAGAEVGVGTGAGAPRRVTAVAVRPIPVPAHVEFIEEENEDEGDEEEDGQEGEGEGEEEAAAEKEDDEEEEEEEEEEKDGTNTLRSVRSATSDSMPSTISLRTVRTLSGDSVAAALGAATALVEATKTQPQSLSRSGSLANVIAAKTESEVIADKLKVFAEVPADDDFAVALDLSGLEDTGALASANPDAAETDVDAGVVTAKWLRGRMREARARAADAAWTTSSSIDGTLSLGLEKQIELEFEDELEGLDFEEIEEEEFFAQQITLAADQVSRLSTEGDDSGILDACQQLLRIFEETPQMVAQFIVHEGIIPTVIDLLDADQVNHDVVLAVLCLLNKLVEEPSAHEERSALLQEFQERLCLAGLFPAVFAFGAADFSSQIRLETAKFVQRMCMANTLTLQIFISCGGLPSLVGFLDMGGYDEGGIETLHADVLAMVHIALDVIVSIFNLQSIAISHSDFCHLFVNYGLLRRLADIFMCFLPASAAERDVFVPLRLQQFGDMFVLFSCGDTVCKGHMCEASVLRCIMHALNPEDSSRLENDAYAYLVVKLLMCVSNLSMAAGTLDELEKAGAIPTLIPFLRRQGGAHAKAWQHHVIHALFYLCRINKRRQEQAVRADLIAPLMQIVRQRSPLRQFALPVLCDLAHASRVTRAHLWAHSAVDMFLDLLEQDYWGTEAFSSLHIWLVNDLVNVETILLRPASLQKLVALVRSAQQADFDNLLDPLLDMVSKSIRLNQALGRSGLFLAEIVARLTAPSSSALVRKSLLRIIQVIVEFHPQPERLIVDHGMCPVLQTLAEDESMVLVAELADQLLRKCHKVIQVMLLASNESDDSEAR
eukprot:g2725.t1